VKPGFERLSFHAPSLAPFGHTKFCLKYPNDCEVRRVAEPEYAARLNHWRLFELILVNHLVNSTIAPQANTNGIFGEEWLVSPKAGDCNDYAVTKRHQLLARGWPSRSLLLAEVVVPSGEHHLILVVRTSRGDLVLDNIARDIRLWSNTGYRWIRVQSPANPRYWWAVHAELGPPASI
jgi:predicted transglutaminase-like cysteine proteinase